MKKLITLTAIAFAFVLAGCNTVSGMGKDIQKAGGAIEDAATKKK